MCGLQPMVFDESEASLCHFVVLVVTWVLGLILVPIRLGLAGIGSSTPLQVSTSLLRRFCMENLRGCLKKIRCGGGSTKFCVEGDGENFRC